MNKHESMRGYFAYELYQHMTENKKIWLLVADLGYGVFDNHFKDFPNRCINVGAAEQSMLDIACGIALNGDIPFCYSITSFLLYRPFETIRTYIDHEQIPVKLIGSGRDKDYAHDGFSHHMEDTQQIMNVFPNIVQMWPKTKEDIPSVVNILLENKRPTFLSLKR